MAIWDEVLSSHALPEGLSAEFIQNEWSQVVQAQGLQSREDYLKAARTGRGTRLDRRTRASLWPIFETFRARMREEGLAEPDDAFREATSLLEVDAETLPYSAVVVDEAQDMGPQAFKLIRAIAPDGEKGGKNSIFIVGDAHQRIYQRRASLSSCGIEVRGRSRRLRLNYRTSENIRRWAVSVLDGVEIDDLDDGTETEAGYKSLFSGVEPEFASASDRDNEAQLIFQRLATLRKATDSDLEAASEPSACVLMRTNREVDAMGDRLRNLGLETVRLRDNQADDPSMPGLRLATMHRSKGLEFDWIFIAGAEEGSLPPHAALASAVDAAMRRAIIDQERSLVHVAATRAKSFLHVSWVGQPASILKGVSS
ncbi:3'-5' exonuclease [Marimonas sp. MJW-29]|uniref:DNA 3'-5' helicase n=1 Tax=Sulfitobacter sediminis TaxID=3234186 RepID=A0ABV3RQ60_9RHOB